MSLQAESIPAFCAGCGLVFPSAIAVGPGGTVGIISDCKQECPRCGDNADILCGTWGGVKDGLKLLNGPNATKEALHRLKIVLQEFQDEKDASADLIADRIKSELPTFSPLAQWFKTNPELAVAIASFLLSVISFICNMQQSGASSIEIEKHFYHNYDQRPRIEEPVKVEPTSPIIQVESSKSFDHYYLKSPYAPKGINIRIRKG